jgi:hypothetical protein
MKKSFLIMYITGFLQAAKMLLEYPYIEKIWDKLDLTNIKREDQYIVKGFVLTGFLVGIIGAFFLWIFTALIGNSVGGIIGAIILFLLLSMKDKCGGLMTLTNYLSLRFSGNSHSIAWKIINNGTDLPENKFYSVTLGFLILIKAIGCLIIVLKNCEFMLIPLLMLNYFIQGFFASCRSLNDKAIFYLELHDLESYCIFGAVLLLLGVHLNFVIWLFCLFVFGLIYWCAYKYDSQNNGYGVNSLNLTGEIGEVILLIIFSLYLI